MEELAFGLIGALVGVGPDEVALGLEKIRGEASCAVAVVVAEGGGESGDRDAVERGEGDDFEPAVLRLAEHLLEERIEHQVHQGRVAAVGVGDAVQEAGTEDAAAESER